jgi:pyruvate/2-oxoacid:ferredoxin oxidoreductase beta subunit
MRKVSWAETRGGCGEAVAVETARKARRRAVREVGRGDIVDVRGVGNVSATSVWFVVWRVWSNARVRNQVEKDQRAKTREMEFTNDWLSPHIYASASSSSSMKNNHHICASHATTVLACDLACPNLEVWGWCCDGDETDRGDVAPGILVVMVR